MLGMTTYYKQRRAKILKLLLKGKNARQIMAECGVSRRHVVWLRRRAESEGLALPPVKPHTNSRPLA